GTGKASDGQIKGIAPGAQLNVVGIVSQAGDPIFPTDLTEILIPGTRNDAKIINLSIGAKDAISEYNNYARSVDQFVYDHPEVLIVIAAGNLGSASNGFPDYWRLTPPATAKNAISVGACCTVRPDFSNTWQQYNPARFPSPPVGSARMSGQPIAPAGLSSSGPTLTRMVKPDVIA